MTLIPKDMTPVYKATVAKGTGAMRWQQAAYVNLLPPCNNTCPAGLNIQAWLIVLSQPCWRSPAGRVRRCATFSTKAI
jgi:hypothetical protein